MTPSAPRFRGLRLEIALALKGRRRTLYETGKAIGRRSGDIQRTVRQLHAEGVLGADSDPPTRGTLYWLAEEWEDAVDAAVDADQQPGRIEPHQLLLHVTAPHRDALYGVLTRSDLAAVIAWAAQGGGDGQWLLALTGDVTAAQSERLIATLQRAGLSCAEQYIGRILSAKDLRLLVTSVEDAAEATA